jgi:hypothetical protein
MDWPIIAANERYRTICPTGIDFDRELKKGNAGGD